MFLFGNDLRENMVRGGAKTCECSRAFLWGLLWGTMSKSVGIENPPPSRLIMGLTIKEIENAKPRAKKYKLADGGGLCLIVKPSGAKLWLWRYRFDGIEKN